jgi:hypothetical protein
MVNRLLVWAGEDSRLERVANTNSLAAKMVHRYVAGPALEDGADEVALGMSPRTIKETFVPPTDYRYPFMR